MQTADDDPSFHINAVLGPWQLTIGGDGKNIRMLCPVASGVYNAGPTAISFDGKNCSIVIEIGMQWVPDPGQFFFVLSGPAKVDAIKADLNQNKIDAHLQSAFAANSSPLSPGAAALVVTAGEEWLITDGTRNFYIFHSADKYNDEFLNVYQFEAAWANDLRPWPRPRRPASRLWRSSPSSTTRPPASRRRPARPAERVVQREHRRVQSRLRLA